MIRVGWHLTNDFSKSKTHETLFIPELIRWCEDNNIYITVYKQYNSGRFSLLTKSTADLDCDNKPRVVMEYYGDISSVKLLPLYLFYSWYFEFENPEHEMLFKLTWSK